MYRLLDFENKEKIIKIINSISYFKLEKDDDLTATSFYSIFDEAENEIGFFGLESREYNLCFCYFYIPTQKITLSVFVAQLVLIIYKTKTLKITI